MKIVALLIAAGIAACGPLDARTITRTMELARTYTGAGELPCPASHRWQECRSSLTPAEAAGGSE